MEVIGIKAVCPWADLVGFALEPCLGKVLEAEGVGSLVFARIEFSLVNFVSEAVKESFCVDVRREAFVYFPAEANGEIAGGFLVGVIWTIKAAPTFIMNE